MHAIVVEQLGDASVLQWREVPDPMPGPGEVTIHVTVSGVNFADIMRRRGGYRGGPPPFTPGLDCAGTIVAVGDDVRGFHIGQRVCAFAREGSYAEIVVAKAVLTYPLPDGVPDEAGAALTMLVTAYNLLTMVSRMQRSESILVHAAAGGMGTMLLQMAKALGAGTKIGVAGGAEKVAIARNAGADVVIDHEREDVAARVRAVVGERGVDVIFDAVAGDMFAQSIPLLALFGRYCIYGMASGKPGTVTTDVLHTGGRAVLGYSTGLYRDVRPEALRDGVRGALEMVAAKQVNVVIGGRYRLKDAAEAHRYVESRASHGKVLLIP
ncbi:MAG TPA: zinc-binding dehydrogenase [Candidatus Acidoferrum sp.]|nr:zinc-binding dehydrogenase [Candidatus Acidoferrum sp.]